MSGELRCPRCDAPFWHFTAVNTRKFECGSDVQIASMGCKYASQLRQRIKRLEEAGDKLAEHHLLVVTTYDKAKDHVTMWTNAKDVKYERHTKNR